MTTGYSCCCQGPFTSSATVLLSRPGKYSQGLIRAILPILVIKPNHPDLLPHPSSQYHQRPLPKPRCRAPGLMGRWTGMPKPLPRAADLAPQAAHRPVTPQDQSQNGRGWKDLWGSPSPPPLPKQGHPSPALPQGAQANVPQTQQPGREVQTAHELFSGNLLPNAA